MKLTVKDKVGIFMVVSTSAALLAHGIDSGHRDSHRTPIADAGGAVTSAVEVATIAFYDVNVVPMDREGVMRSQVVLVQDGFVTRIGPVGVVEVPAGSLRIEGGGTRYLAPGLTDAHVHLGDDPESTLPLYVANGVTTVFNLQGDDRVLALRERVLAGEVVGPTIYTAGPFVDAALVRSPTDARRVVEQQREDGYDFVKLHGDLERESFETLTETGVRLGIPIVGHAPRNLPFSAVLQSHQASVSHAEELIYTEFMSLNPDDLVGVADQMADAGTWLTPGLATFANTAEQWGAPEGLRAALDRPDARFLPPALRREWESSTEYVEKDALGRPRIEQMLAFHLPLIRSFHGAGVPILAGTDAGVPGMVPGFALRDEIVALNGAGLSRFDALAAATRNAGRFVRENVDRSASFGTVRVESRADLVLLDGDPRAGFDVLRRPVGVMVRGRWYDRAALDQMLSRTPTGR